MNAASSLPGRRARLCGLSLYLLLVIFPFLVTACSKGEANFLNIGTAPIGGAFHQVGGALSEVLNTEKGDNSWTVRTRSTKGSQENIRLLDAGKLNFAMSNAAITYFAVRGESGWDKKYGVQAIMTLAPNVAMFITKEGSGVKTIADLKGKRVVVGPSGAGFRMFLEPILKAHGVTYDDFEPLHSGQSGAVEHLSDGSAAAAFLGGAVPTSSITQACSTHDIYFVPYSDAAMAQLVKDYPFFHPATVTAGKYSDLDADFHGLNVGSMHLITSADADEELVYQVTRTIYENRADVIAKHPAGRAIEKNATRNTGVDFHPGAIRYYKEIGVWPTDTQGTGIQRTEGAAGADSAAGKQGE